MVTAVQVTNGYPLTGAGDLAYSAPSTGLTEAASCRALVLTKPGPSCSLDGCPASEAQPWSLPTGGSSPGYWNSRLFLTLWVLAHTLLFTEGSTLTTPPCSLPSRYYVLPSKHSSLPEIHICSLMRPLAVERMNERTLD